jgi:hypothetical protein
MVLILPDVRKKALLQGLADPGVSNAVGLLFDVSQSKSLSARSRNDMVAMAYFLAQHADAFAKRVALVAFDDFPFAMMRMAENFPRRSRPLSAFADERRIEG